MNKPLELVKKMHKHFKLSREDLPKYTVHENNHRVRCMCEEIDEYTLATNSEERLDALIDLAVLVLGTIERQGMCDIFEEAFERVIENNMTKSVGANIKRNNFMYDLVKPADWEPPVLSDLIKCIDGV